MKIKYWTFIALCIVSLSACTEAKNKSNQNNNKEIPIKDSKLHTIQFSTQHFDTIQLNSYKDLLTYWDSLNINLTQLKALKNQNNRPKLANDPLPDSLSNLLLNEPTRNHNSPCPEAYNFV